MYTAFIFNIIVCSSPLWVQIFASCILVSC